MRRTVQAFLLLLLGLAPMAVVTSASAVLASPPELGWALQLPGASHGAVNAVSVDRFAQVVLGLSVYDTVDADPGAGSMNLTSDGAADVGIVRLDAAGGLVWALRFGGSGDDVVEDVALGPDGSVFVTGQFEGTVDFDPGVGESELTSDATGGDDFFLVKFDAAGGLEWAHAFGGSTGGGSAGGLVAEPDGPGVYLVGQLNGTADMDPDAVAAAVIGDGSEAFAARYDGSGDLLFAGATGGTGGAYAHNAAVDSSGDLIVVGEFHGTVDFDPGAGTSELASASDSVDGFIWRLGSNGSLGSVGGIGGDSTDIARGIAVDSNDHFYVTGSIAGTFVDMDPDGVGTWNLDAVGGSDVFVLEGDETGDLVWAQRYGGSGPSIGVGVVADGSGAVTVVGYHSGAFDADPNAGTEYLEVFGGDDGFVLGLDTAGLIVWAGAFGGTSTDQPSGIEIAGSGTMVVAGYFWSTADFDLSSGETSLASAGQSDGFAFKLGSYFCSGWMATIEGTSQGDTLTGTPGRDAIVGLEGADTIDGMEKGDRICGGSGPDLIYGGTGSDRIHGDGGADVIDAQKGKDRAFGDGGADTVLGKAGADFVSGGADVDTVSGGFGVLDWCEIQWGVFGFGDEDTYTGCELPTTTWYEDNDGDGFGNPDAYIEAFLPLTNWYSRDASDCDDTDPNVSPGGSEGPFANGIDDDCDGLIDEGTSP